LNREKKIGTADLDDDHPHLIADLGNEEINDLAVSADGNHIGLICGKWIHGAVLIEGLS